MDLSSNRSQDEDRITQRQLYRPGQNNKPAQASASTASRPSSPAAAKPKRAPASSRDNKGQRILLMILLLGVGYYLLNGTPSQRRKAFIGLGVAAWLLFLGAISYCLSLPDLDGMNRERMALFQDKNLTPEERREKMESLREREKNLTPDQRKQMGQLFRKEMIRKGNANTFSFLQMSEEDQVAQLKKEAAEWEKRRQEMRKMWGNKGKQKGGNNRNGQNGNKGGGQNGGRGGGGPGGGGPGGGFGGGGGGGNEATSFESRQGAMSPEARAGGLHKAMMREQMGLGGGFGGGPGGGRGGPGGGRGGPPGGG